MFLVFLLTRIVFGVASENLVRRTGAGGVHVAPRVLGILLAALAVQFVLNGLGEYVRISQAGQG